MAANQAVVLGQAPGDRRLQVRRGGEGEELVGLGDRRRSAPARRRGSRPSSRSGRTSCRPSRSSRVRSRMPGQADQRAMCRRPSNTTCSQTSSQTAIGVVADAELGQQRQVLPRRRRVAAGFSGLLSTTSRVRSAERLPPAPRGQAPVRRAAGCTSRGDAAGAAHHRQVGVVERLEQHHLVARLDQGQEGGGQRLGGAGGDGDLARPVELQALEAAVVVGHRLAQLRQARPWAGTGCSRSAPPRPPWRARPRGPGSSGKPWPRLIAPRCAGQARHHLEDGGRQVGEDRVHPAIKASRMPPVKS